MVIFFYLLNIIIIILKLRIIYLYSLVRAGPGCGLQTGPALSRKRCSRRSGLWAVGCGLKPGPARTGGGGGFTPLKKVAACTIFVRAKAH